MFSFHKPKVYRSIDGCCICRAKSSSSRFTDSKRYEADFKNCFQTLDSREGDICNACVLLVKRWKKLPRGTARHWNHVVDARAGPGNKPLSKTRGSPYKHNHRTRSVVSQSEFYPDSPGGDSCDVSDNSSDDSDIEISSSAPQPISKSPPSYFSSFLDPTYWKHTKVCCGVIFVGPHGAVMIDPRLLKPCLGCRKNKGGLTRSNSTDTESEDRGDNSDGSTTGEVTDTDFRNSQRGVIVDDYIPREPTIYQQNELSLEC